MAIKVSENGRLFTLQTKDSSYQMFADDKNVLLHLYYGEKIGEENLSGLIFCTDMGFAGNPEEAGPNRKYSLDTLPQEIPGSGVGDFRDDMIDIRHADGSFAADVRFDSFEILDHSYAGNAGAVRYRERKRRDSCYYNDGEGFRYCAEAVLRCI